MMLDPELDEMTVTEAVDTASLLRRVEHITQNRVSTGAGWEQLTRLVLALNQLSPMKDVHDDSL